MGDERPLERLEDTAFEASLKLIYELTGITVSKNRKSMVQGRLRKRILELGLGSYEEYLDRVGADVAERPTFIDLVTTNETYFYRTPRIWGHIVDIFLPAWLKDHKGETFQAWSAAASSGEEAHTLALFLQDFKERNPAFNYQIFGSDISQEMIGLCQSGRYAGRSVEAIRKAKPELFSRYMESDGGKEPYRLRSEIKGRIRFQRHNLFEPLAERGPFDLVMVRNVLIYFKPEDQEKVIALIEPKMREEGCLVIGESESLTHIRTSFLAEQPLIYRKAGYLRRSRRAA